MATKKAIWSIVGYTDSCPDLANAISVIEGAGGRCMWIIHNRDRYDHDDPDGKFKQGEPDKVHYHVACGWSKRAPDWAQFVKIMQNAKLCCPGDKGQYTPGAARVKAPEALEDYFLHRDEKSKNNPYKHQYNESELHMSEGWNVDDYTTYMDKRKAASEIRKEQRKEDAGACGYFFDLVRSHEITEYCILVDMVCSVSPDKLGDLLANSYPIKSYIDSRRSFNAAEIKRNTAESKRNESLNRMVRELKTENAQLKRDLQDALEHERDVIDRCRCVLENLGEPSPEWMEI